MRLIFLLCLILYPCFSFAEKCAVILGVSETPYSPYSWIGEDHTVHGLNIDLMNRLTSRAKCDLKIKILSWDELLKAFSNNEVDTIATSLSPYIDSAKGKDLLLIPITTTFYGNFYVRNDGVEIKSLDELYYKNVLVLKGSTSHDYARNFLQKRYGIDIIPFNTTEEAIIALSEGKGDVGLFSITAVRNTVDAENIKNLKLSGATFLPASYGFIFKKDNEKMYSKLNKQLGFVVGMNDYSQHVNSWSNKFNSIDDKVRVFVFLMVVILIVMLLVSSLNYALNKMVKERTRQLNLEVESNKLLELEKLTMQEQSMSIGKLAALGEMASCVAHEINNPTALVIHNFSSIKRKVLKLASMVSESNKKDALISEIECVYSIIDDSLKRTINSIDQLKRLGGNDSTPDEVVDLRDCLSSAIELVKHYVNMFTPNLIIRNEVECRVICKKHSIEQIIINLVQNACHSLVDNKGFIECGVKSSVIDGKVFFELYVKDNGCGIPDCEKELIFKPFYTTRKNTGGTGLGLSIVKRLVQENNAVMILNSSEGNGTTVSIIFEYRG